MKNIFAAIFALIGLCIPALAWGPEGHVIVGMIADDRLPPDIKVKARALLSGAPLATASIFADEYRLTHPETARWHYVDIPYDAASYDESRDCVTEMGGDCIIKAIARVEAVISDANARFYDRQDALKFLVHFMGDLHQPFHAIERPLNDGSPDQGGNLVHVKFFGAGTNLHSLWDSGLILHTGKAAEDYARELEGKYLAGKTNGEFAQGGLMDWAKESHDAAKAAYVGDKSDLGQPYFDSEIGVVDERLALAGARLASEITRLLGPVSMETVNAP